MKNQLVLMLGLIFLLLPWNINRACDVENNCQELACTLNNDCAQRCNNPNCQNCSQKEDEQKLSRQQVQQLAIATLSNMAQSIASIGSNPHDPTSVATNITSLVGAFAGFVAQAIRNPKINVNSLLEDESFVDMCSELILRSCLDEESI